MFPNETFYLVVSSLEKKSMQENKIQNMLNYHSPCPMLRQRDVDGKPGPDGEWDTTVQLCDEPEVAIYVYIK